MLPHVVRGLLCTCVLTLSTLILCLSLVPPALAKLLLRVAPVRAVANRVLNALASAWVAVNNAWIAAANPAAVWDVQGLEGLNARGWYLLACNHVSAVDILALQRVFHGRIPFLKFFLKRELIWVPVIGLAWWALDFPFMRRGKTRKDMRRDLESTRRACEKFRDVPTSVMNFVEGTRVTPLKRAAERSPYRHLLKPKVGGLSVALATMGEQFEALLDVTLVYPRGTPTFWQLLCGRVDAVTVRVQRREIPGAVLGMDAAGERARMVRQGRWLEQIWVEKDALIESLLATSPGSPNPAPARTAHAPPGADQAS